MKLLFILLTLSLALWAKNPLSFATLGDVVYNDAKKFDEIKELEAMHDIRVAINNYIKLANDTKKLGFSVDNKEKGVDAKGYLKRLRTLSAEHDVIITQVRKRFSEAMSDEDSHTVNTMVEHGVIDPVNYEKELVTYYEEYREDYNLSALKSIYEQYLINTKSTQKVDSESSETRNQRSNDAALERARAQRKLKQENLEREVQEEQTREKKRVLREQKEALGIE